MKRWKEMWTSNPTWRPFHTGVHGEAHRVFTDDEESALADYIQTEIIDPGYLFTNFDFKILAVNAFLTKHQQPNEPAAIPDFQASNGFAGGFKARHNFSSRRHRFKRRPKPDDPSRPANWENEIARIFESTPLEHILNCDETSWRLFPSGILTWAERGTDGVQIRANGSAKASLTALATISAAACKFPLHILAKGRTLVSEEGQIGDVAHHWRGHSENGWTTSETFEQYLMLLRQHVGADGPDLHLLLDVYSAHRTLSVKQLADGLRIRLHYIRAGMTDRYQPLDVRVFGCLKATGRQVFRERVASSPNEELTTRSAVQMLVWAWKHLSIGVIEDAWEIYTTGEE